MNQVEYICTRFPRGTLSGIMAMEGPFLRRVANHRVGRLVVRHLTHGGLGRVAIRAARLTGLLEGRNPIELALFVLRYFFAGFLEEETVTDQEAVFYLSRCPYGWRTASDAPLCDAVMQLERELVAGMGASLTIEETIPGGAPKCRFTLRAAPAGTRTNLPEQKRS